MGLAQWPPGGLPASPTGGPGDTLEGGRQETQPRDPQRPEGTGVEVRRWCWEDLECRFPLGLIPWV